MRAVVTAFAATTHGKEGTGCMKITHSIYSTAEAVDSLTKKWIAFYGDPANSARLNAFTDELDREVRRRLPGDKLGGILRGQEDEIRQRALKLLTNKFLHGNRELLVSTEAGAAASICRELHRSIGAAIRVALRRTAREINGFNRRHVLYSEIPESCYLPLINLDLACLPIDRCLELLRTAVTRAVASGSIARGDGDLVLAITSEGERVADAALRLSVSRRTIYRRLKTLAPRLRTFVSQTEVAL
jgi:hypothetical protein